MKHSLYDRKDFEALKELKCHPDLTNYEHACILDDSDTKMKCLKNGQNCPKSIQK